MDTTMPDRAPAACAPRRRAAAAGAAAALLLSACGSGAAPEPEPAATEDVSTIGQPADPSPSASAEAPAGIDVTVIPDEITVEYAQAVIDAIYEEYGSIVVEVLAEPAGLGNEITEDQFDRLFAILEGEALTFRVEELTGFATDEASRAGLLSASEFTGQSYRVLRLVEGAPDCIVVIARTDLSGSTGGGEADAYSALSLAPADGEGLTAWRVLQGVTSAQDEERQALFLEATLEDFGDALATTCGAT